MKLTDTEKKTQSGCLLLFIAVILIAIIQTKLGCGDPKEVSTENNTNQFIEERPAEDFRFSSCEEESKYLLSLIRELESRIKELKRTYDGLKDEPSNWDVYISEYNGETWSLNDQTRNYSFNCIQTYLFQNLRAAYGQIGLNYLNGPTKKSKFFESKFKEFSSQIIKDLKEKKEMNKNY